VARSDQYSKSFHVPIFAKNVKLVPSTSADGGKNVDQFVRPKTVVWISGAEMQDLSEFIGATG
jgi:hypothetical protein